MTRRKKILRQNEEFANLKKEDYLKITFEIENGVVAKDGFLFFDGILASCAIKRALKDDYVFVEENEFDFVDLPLYSKFFEVGGRSLRVFYASHLKLGDRKTIDKWRKRFDDKFLRYCDTKVIDTQRGFFKSYNMPYTIYLVDKLTFCVKGNGEMVARLLRYLDGIGGLRKLGHGKIKSTKIEKVDYCEIIRRIPTDNITPGQLLGIGAVTPPYFKNPFEVAYYIDTINKRFKIAKF